MGARFVVLIDEDDKIKAQEGADAAFKEAERLNMVLSDYESSSELVRFSESSRTGEKFMLSQDLFEVLSHSRVWRKKRKDILTLPSDRSPGFGVLPVFNKKCHPKSN